MSAIAIPRPNVATKSISQLSGFWDTPIGKKAVMAVTGVILFGFVTGHMIGNLQIYLGPEKLDAYAKALHSLPGLLWGVRLALLAAVGLHILASVQLTKQSWAARPVGYRKKEAMAASYAARTMRWSGPIIAAFIVYHLLHFTVGSAHPHFQELQVYRNVVTGFQVIPVSIAYIVAMILLGMHLNHGLWSMFQSLGISHPRYTPKFKVFAQVFSAVIVIGNCSIPISIMTGLVR
ncbi:MAG: succinate dehydrogenase cytochrome b subunit [Bryobacteraceae bacterium]